MTPKIRPTETRSAQAEVVAELLTRGCILLGNVILDSIGTQLSCMVVASKDLPYASVKVVCPDGSTFCPANVDASTWQETNRYDR